jgi:hypothetical protein
MSVSVVLGMGVLVFVVVMAVMAVMPSIERIYVQSIAICNIPQQVSRIGLDVV